MSTDFELLHDIRFPKLKVQSSNKNGTVIHDENECRTPISKENKIPAVVSCPPAPKKPKRRGVSCKRKLNFFDIVNREEVDTFLKAASDDSVSKRRCPCT
ncbi:Detected protein of unknown function [Hibiscus syriacus]|uniref:Uncharacterized protein n=1 Tax=Hibiscus syriacus TaxID=106335 RepID=A0A6A2WMV6_HIBSY|nr:cyclin-dependent protein kinase inhibitor SMR3-like [Hibiscus syriacus]KAE8661593.1 Detected protein of unknown function [Hibiscus syriacus]